MKTRTLIKTADNVTEADSLLHSVDAKLTEDEKSLCEKDVTKEEIHKVIKLLKSNKSPGDDGIIAEFYKTYWYPIHNELTFVIKFILEAFIILYYILNREIQGFLVKIKMLFLKSLKLFISSKEINLCRLDTFRMVANKSSMYTGYIAVAAIHKSQTDTRCCLRL